MGTHRPWCYAHYAAQAYSVWMSTGVRTDRRGRLVEASYTRSIWARVVLPAGEKAGKPGERANQEVEKLGAEVHPSMHLGADIGRDSSVHRRLPQ